MVSACLVAAKKRMVFGLRVALENGLDARVVDFACSFPWSCSRALWISLRISPVLFCGSPFGTPYPTGLELLRGSPAPRFAPGAPAAASAQHGASEVGLGDGASMAFSPRYATTKRTIFVLQPQRKPRKNGKIDHVTQTIQPKLLHSSTNKRHHSAQSLEPTPFNPMQLRFLGLGPKLYNSVGPSEPMGSAFSRFW